MLQLAQIFQPHMTIQQGKVIRVFGTAGSGETVRAAMSQKHPDAPDAVLLSKADTVSGEDGCFLLELPPVSAGCGYTLSVSAGNGAIHLNDVMAGDVWMAMGQSNMEFFLRYDADWDHTRMDVHRSGPDRMLRMYNTPQIAYEGQTDPSPANGVWFTEEEEPWRSFSAPGYHFARYLRDRMDGIPQAVIGCNWGGTPAQAWMSREYLEKEPLDRLWKNYTEAFAQIPEDELKEASMKAWESERSYSHVTEFSAVLEGLSWTEQLRWMQMHDGDPEIPMGPWHHYRPCGVFDTMVRKIAPFSVKGILWYQGESNSGEDAVLYCDTMQALVSCLRKVWLDDTLPFYYMQIAPFARWLGCTGEGYAVVRHQQDLASSSIPHCHMSNVMDLGERDDIHPKFKKEVGRRLACIALQHVYRQKDVTGESPVFVSAEEIKTPEENSAGPKAGGYTRRFRLSFANCGSGLSAGAVFESAVHVFTEKSDSHAGTWPDGDCSPLTQSYFTKLTGFDYSRPVPVTKAEVDGDSILLAVCLDRPDDRICISFAQSDWCEVTLRSSSQIPVKPFHTVL